MGKSNSLRRENPAEAVELLRFLLFGRVCFLHNQLLCLLLDSDQGFTQLTQTFLGVSYGVEQ